MVNGSKAFKCLFNLEYLWFGFACALPVELIGDRPRWDKPNFRSSSLPLLVRFDSCPLGPVAYVVPFGFELPLPESMVDFGPRSRNLLEESLNLFTRVLAWVALFVWHLYLEKGTIRH